jgi:hypothetical protein
MIMERAQSLTRLITQFPDIISIKKSPTMGIPFPVGVDHAVGDQFNSGAGPTAQLSDGV